MDKEPPFLKTSLSPWSKTEATRYFHGALTERIIACAIEVHRQLGPGFLEAIYERAFAMELVRCGLPFRKQVPVAIQYRGTVIGGHRLDLVIDNKVVVELKAIRAIDDAHLATCLSYLKATGIRVGLIINFSEAKTRVRRVMRAAEFDHGDREGGRQGGFKQRPEPHFENGRPTIQPDRVTLSSRNNGHKDGAHDDEASLQDPQLE